MSDVNTELVGRPTMPDRGMTFADDRVLLPGERRRDVARALLPVLTGAG